MSGIRARKHVLRRSALLAFVPAVFALPCFAADNGELLSDRPQRAAQATEFEARASTIAPSIDVTYKALGEAANAAADTFAGPASGRTRIGCQNVGFGGSTPVNVTLFKGCADYDWRINAQRNGSITFKRAGDGIEVDIPVKFTGDGNFRGDLAKAIQTPPETVQRQLRRIDFRNGARRQRFLPARLKAARRILPGARHPISNS